jgi:hypothetical protein
VSVQKENHCQQMDFQEVEGNSLLKEFADNAEDYMKFKSVVF